MKKNILFILIFTSLSLSYAQVGVNTENPKGILHIDGASTSATTNPTVGVVSDIQASDDFIITAEGNLGLGTITPSTKLEIHTRGTALTPIKGFTLKDGNEAAGKVLTSDIDGKATWMAPGFSEFQTISGHITPPLSYTIGGSIIDTGYSLTFPSAGTYLVTIGLSVVDSNGFSPSKSYIIQLMPTNTTTDWNSPTNRYIGSYEAYAIQAGTDHRGRIYFSQALTIPSGKLTAYLIFAHNGATIPGTITLYLGENGYPGCPQCTGGAYVRIN